MPLLYYTNKKIQATEPATTRPQRLSKLMLAMAGGPTFAQKGLSPRKEIFANF